MVKIIMLSAYIFWGYDLLAQSITVDFLSSIINSKKEFYDVELKKKGFSFSSIERFENDNDQSYIYDERIRFSKSFKEISDFEKYKCLSPFSLTIYIKNNLCERISFNQKACYINFLEARLYELNAKFIQDWKKRDVSSKGVEKYIHEKKYQYKNISFIAYYNTMSDGKRPPLSDDGSLGVEIFSMAN